MDNYLFYLPTRAQNFKSTKTNFDRRSPSFFRCISQSRRWRPWWLHLLLLPIQFRTLFRSWLEGESFFLPIDVKSDFSSTTNRLPSPGPTCQPLCCNVGSPPPPRLHLRHSLSQFDPRAHVGPSWLYNPAPASLPRHNASRQVILEDRNLYHPQSSSIF